MFKRALFNDVGAVKSLGGAGINAALNASLHSLVNEVSHKPITEELLDGDFNREEAKRMENLIRQRGIKILQPEDMVPHITGTHNKNIAKGFKEMSPRERARVLLGLGDPGPFHSRNDNIDKSFIYKGPSGSASAATLAHELGHAMNAADLKNSIWAPVRNFAYRAGRGTRWITPLLTGAGAVGASDSLLLKGGILGSALKLPMIAEELIASWRGKKFMDANGFKSNSWNTFEGVPTYLQSAITPLLPWLSRKAMRAMSGEYT